MFFFGVAILSLGFLPVRAGPFCDDCGDGKEALGVLMFMAIVGVALFLAIILPG